MIRINPVYLDLFKSYYGTYIYYVSPGVFLSFDKETLEYKSNISIYGSYGNKNDIACSSKINNLINKGILEVYD